MLTFGARSMDKQLHCNSIPLPVASLTVVLEFVTNCLMLCSTNVHHYPVFLSFTFNYPWFFWRWWQHGNMTMQLETQRIFILKDLHCVFSLTYGAADIFQSSDLLWKASCSEANISASWWPCSCFPILCVIYPLPMYLNNVHFQVPLCIAPCYYINSYGKYFSTGHCCFQESVLQRK